jgi:molecular chaperone GrpE
VDGNTGRDMTKGKRYHERPADGSEVGGDAGQSGPAPEALGGRDDAAPAATGDEALGVVDREIAGLREELSQVNAKWLRALADLDNYRKRVERDRCRWSEAAREEVLLDILEVMDNFERAVACGDGSGPAPDDPYRRGVELILGQLRSVLAKHGVRPIDTCGAEFDPALHEAIGHIESPEHASNQIVEEERKGYMLGDRLLRCSRVVVAK